MAKVIAVANQKGGVGKTTVTRELSACCALRGYQTLVIDCDPQGNLTQSWVDSEVYELTLSHVLIDPESKTGRKDPLPLADAVVESPLKNLEIVPADIRLARFDFQPDYVMHRLKNQIEQVSGMYDLIFLDCPPQLGRLLNTALYSADYVIIPCAADAMGLPGLTDLAYTVSQIQNNVNSRIQMLGAVMNLYKASRNLSAEAREAVEGAIDLVGYVFDTNLHDYTKIAEAPSQRLPVLIYAPEHKASEQLNNLTDEVLERLNLNLNQNLTLVSGSNNG